MKTSETKIIRAMFAGDLALGGEFLRRARPDGERLTFPFAPLRERLRDVDLMVVNLEGPIGDEGTARTDRSTLLHNDAEVLDWLGSFPVAVCTMANNHALDYGPEALARTRRLLWNRGIHVVGAGANQIEAESALKIRMGERVLGFFAFTTDEPHVGSIVANGSQAGCCGLRDEEEICARVRQIAADVDFLTVLPHWGREYFDHPSPRQVKLTRKLIAAGAHLVAGHHPHVPQGWEQIDGALIAHSLGNLLLPEMRNANGRLQHRKEYTKEFALLAAEIDVGRIASWSLIGGRRDRRFRLRPYVGGEARRFEEKLLRLSRRLESPAYETFWSAYEKQRTRGLQREELRDAVAKFLRTDFRTLRRTLSPGDLRRNFERLSGLLFARRNLSKT